jgi:hypothetical protein
LDREAPVIDGVVAALGAMRLAQLLERAASIQNQRRAPRSCLVAAFCGKSGRTFPQVTLDMYDLT